MSWGASATLANSLVTAFGGTPTGYSNVYLQLHTGDPGASGTANVSAESTRVLLSWDAASGGVRVASSTPEWDPWDAGTETLEGVSFWDSLTTGTFLFSAELDAPLEVEDDDVVSLPQIELYIPVAS